MLLPVAAEEEVIHELLAAAQRRAVQLGVAVLGPAVGRQAPLPARPVATALFAALEEHSHIHIILFPLANY